MSDLSKSEKRTSAHVWICSIILTALVLLEWRHSPLAFLRLRENVFFLIFSRCIFTLPMLYFTWKHSHSEQLPIVGKLLCTIAFMLPLGVFVPGADRVVLVMALVLLGVLMGYGIWLLRQKEGKNFKGSDMPFAASGLMFAMFFMARFRFETIGNTVSNYVPALAVSVVLVIVYIVYTVKKNKAFKQDGKVRMAALMSVTTLLVTFAFAVVTIDTLNYALDFGPTSQMQTKVLDKDSRTSGGKYRTTKYYLTVSINGEEEEVRVPLDVYKSHEIGDRVEMEMGEGAFGITYVVPD